MTTPELEESLRKLTFSPDLKTLLVQRLWGNIPSHVEPTPLEPYFEYYSTRCKEFLCDGGSNVSIKTHADSLRIANLILQDEDKDSIIHNLAEGSASTLRQRKLDEASIHLVAGLLTMAEVGVLESGATGRRPLKWTGGSLRSLLAAEFAPQKEMDASAAKIEKRFIANNISKIAGIELKWTSNLADHLLLHGDDKSVYIFHHAEFHKFQSLAAVSFWPDGLLDETLRTLALLFPQNDRGTRRLLAGIKGIDQTVGCCGVSRAQDRRFEKFSVWHDRLVILKQAFDDSRPQTISQWWWDRRNGVQWYTFWVAIMVFILTVFFGTVQSIEGALQVYLSYKSLQGDDGTGLHVRSP
ncbi:hypothetical protein QBC34DRAFT_360139 [Podospora aff. communis PSN243]|uniref:Uncharacterized protein n=1 Tax=Podospora aff. communis PSN243 TaxID=3040156 RepID=A0AAV9G759_9PEZI|nr:hypothetical protein QBC34DRAFT_360139 [Podospora aff. communis PSN243]